MTTQEDTPILKESHFVPLKYGNLVIFTNLQDEPIFSYYSRPYSGIDYNFSSSCKTIYDVVNEFIEPIPTDDYINTNKRIIINHITHTSLTLDEN